MFVFLGLRTFRVVISMNPFCINALVISRLLSLRCYLCVSLTDFSIKFVLDNDVNFCEDIGLYGFLSRIWYVQSPHSIFLLILHPGKLTDNFVFPS